MDRLRTELSFGRLISVDQAIVANSSRSCKRQITHSDQIVGGTRGDKHPPDPDHATMASFAQRDDGFEPAEDFFNSLRLR